MRPKKVEDEKLILNLMSVLRKKGYEGSSLNELAESAGLQKASLYHRFPGGKKEIVDVVLDFADQWVSQNVYNLLIDENLTPENRLMKVIDTIDEDLYKHGHEMCLLRALSMDSGVGLFGTKIKDSMNLWIDAFIKLGESFGFDEETSKQKAINVLIHIQGSLIVSESLGSVAPFQSTLKSIEKLYMK